MSPHLEFLNDSGTVRGVAYHPLGTLTLCPCDDAPRPQTLDGLNPLAVLVASRANLDDNAAQLDQHGVSHAWCR